MRSYRGSLAVLKRAAEAWRMQPHSFILQLGDIIDGQNSGKYGQGLSKFSPSGCQSDIALRAVLSVFSRFGWSSDKIYSAVGNHEFYCWPERSALASKIPQICSSTSNGHFYQSFSPAAGWRVIILDAYDVSIIGRHPHSLEFKQAIDLLQSNNPNILADGSATGNFLTDLCVFPFVICFALCPHFFPFAARVCRADLCLIMARSAEVRWIGCKVAPFMRFIPIDLLRFSDSRQMLLRRRICHHLQPCSRSAGVSHTVMLALELSRRPGPYTQAQQLLQIWTRPHRLYFLWSFSWR